MKALSLVLAGLLMAASAFAEPTRTVSWWRGHAAERTALLSKCRDNPGQLANTPNCLNGERAEFREQLTKNGGFYWRPITKESLGPTPWRRDNPNNPLPFYQKRDHHE